MSKKIPIYIFLMFLLLLNVTNNVYAASVGFADYSSGSSGGTSDDDKDPEVKYYSGSGYGNKKYKVTYNYSINANTDIDVNAYNLDGESVMPKTVKPTKSFLSGTSIGLNIIETRAITWNVNNFKFQEVRKKYQCTYEGKYVYDWRWYYLRSASSCRSRCYSRHSTVKDYYAFTTDDGRAACNCYVKVQDDYELTVVLDYNETCSKTTTHNGKTYTLKDTDLIEEVLIDVKDPNLINNFKYDIVAPIQKKAQEYAKRNTIDVNYINTNTYETRIDEKNKEQISDLISTVSKPTPVTNFTAKITKSNIKTNGTEIATYTYLEKVCMNLKTAEVSYGRECQTNEIEIENKTVYDEYLKKNVTYWNYFIPLNTKSNSQFYITLEKKGASKDSLSKKECENVIDRYPREQLTTKECINVINKNKKTYQDLISPIEGYFSDEMDINKDKVLVQKQKGCYSEETIGVTYQDLIVPNSTKSFVGNVTEDKKLVAKGCYLSTKVNFVIDQKFYNETSEGDTLKLKGFNFYYRPIDISNPFPNGIADDSYWKQWEEDGKKDPNLSQSFDKISYIATDINATKVRNYSNTSTSGKKNTYTSWYNMSLNGKSTFINTYVSRQNTGDIYKLGCGPLNENKYLDNKEPNPLYRSWCQS